MCPGPVCCNKRNHDNEKSARGKEDPAKPKIIFFKVLHFKETKHENLVLTYVEGDTEFQSVDTNSEKRPWAYIRLANNCSRASLS